MKALLMMFVAFFLAGCAQPPRPPKTTTVITIRCEGCAKTIRCEECGKTERTKQTTCNEGKIQGEFGQVFRVECPGGKVVPDIVR